jgi:hypothetical protein
MRSCCNALDIPASAPKRASLTIVLLKETPVKFASINLACSKLEPLRSASVRFALIN